ncbi:MAG: hypothetical protein NXY57DRAFT_1075729 [Lentinula lateritia]|nr:MAG: hypothetical protein NXY57DRAFT_1075729 [Lentinula lateritia]
MTEEQIKALQSTGGAHLAATEKNILRIHLGKLWDTVKELQVKTNGRIDFVLDNTGFELYCDMVYTDFLVQSGLATEIHFQRKRYPWFVSDVTKKTGTGDVELESLRRLGARWKVAPDLFLHLSRSDLAFFKGDLNHRKLTYDCAAPA